MLNESDKIVNDQNEVANHYNFFSTVAENIGKDTVYDPSDHPSLLEIKNQNDCTNKFVFEKVTTDKVEKIMNNINIKKATGADGIPAKVIKCSKSVRERPFNLKGGVMVFCFVHKFFFEQHES